MFITNQYIIVHCHAFNNIYKLINSVVLMIEFIITYYNTYFKYKCALHTYCIAGSPVL